MNWYKIAQTTDFYEWYTNEVLNMTKNYSQKIPSVYNEEIMSDIAKSFGDLTKKQLKQLTFNDLYIINYLMGGGHTFGTILDRTLCERIGGMDKQWLLTAIKKFPEILTKYVIPRLINEVKRYPYLYKHYLPMEVRYLFPDEVKEELKNYFEEKLLNKQVSYNEIPEDLRSELKPSTKEMIVNTFATALKGSHKPEESYIIPDDLREDILKKIKENA